ncbi:dual OB domain-containing protein [Dysgonomonas macrotermitis]|uniref:Dual OB-containing domain-containing protein n=1 Tax=Dysgonomonas macrotermitis TaxID=1346286 RepID=A0A1M4WM78_9BACT|nr:hypothetical protein [Dysgonomonas macrotermitis]SHE82305.1 hypothetical protein SAMN05444362_102261 [Dysgonomonas macrotermitis]
MDVLVVSKTKMQHGICVGGVTANGNFVRLLDENGYHPDDSTNYEIRQVWEITYRNPNNPRSLPHSEDVCVISKRLKGILDEDITMIDFLNRRNVNIYQGSISNLFESKLQYTQNGAGFINRDDIPQNSVCFWIADRDINRSDYNGKIRYNYNDGSRRWGYNISYVGLSEPIDNIPQGTLIRMSLAHWWSPDDSDVEERCYLQLSGWYQT